MNICIAAKNTIVGFSVIKALLQSIQYEPHSQYELVSLRVLFPDNKPAIEAQQQSSLTEAAPYEEQIRFSLKERVLRSFYNISSALAQQNKSLNVIITNAELLDEGSQIFLQILSERPEDINVRLLLGQSQELASISYVSSHREEKIEQIVTTVGQMEPANRDFILQEAERYINCGDAWTAERILKRLEVSEATSKIHSMLGITYGILKRTIEAEFYYEKWRASGKPSDLIHANYVLAMLYARHHPEQLRSLPKAAEYLEEAYQILQTLTEDEIPNITFERIFNRNGYALVLVRTERIDEAIRFLKQGIAELGELGDSYKRIYLHKTVLIYNLAQCYKLLEQIQDAITNYKFLLELDPKFPEYHMELAQCYIDTGNYPAAISSLEEARNFDPSITEIYSLLGFCWQEIGNLKESIENYRAAYLCEPRKPDVCYDYAYALAEQNLYRESFSVLERADLRYVPPTLQEDIFSLRAEATFNQGNPVQALEILHEGVRALPTSAKLQENIALLESVDTV